MSKLAIFFPGIGYTNSKPLLYYSRMLAKNKGYEEICVEYGELPTNVKGDVEKMREALRRAYDQCCEILKGIDFTKYEDVIIIGKSLGTVVASKYHEEYCKSARLILYTPVEATFRYVINEGIAFIGDNDTWSDLDKVKSLADKAGVPLHIYANCNHSLEVLNDYDLNTTNLKNIMKHTYDYI